MKKLIAIALFGGAAALTACGTNTTTTSQAERDRDASRGTSTAPANPATANQGGQPHSGSGSVK